MISDSDLSKYTITLQDVDGITIGGTNYKINSGNKISLGEKRFTMELPTIVNYRNRNNKEYSTTMAYSTLIGEHTFNGINNLKMRLDGIIWFDENDTPRNSIGTPVSIKLLNDIRVFNHKLYLQDYQGTSTSVVTPIYSLCKKPDLLGNYVGNTTYGLPVVVTEINNISRGSDTLRGEYITYTLELEEDR